MGAIAHEGVPVDIGGRVFIVPPLTIGAFKRTRADRKLLGEPATDPDDRTEAACRVIHATLVRNYPDLKIEDIEELLTFENMVHVLPQIVSAWSAGPGKAQAENPST